MFHLRTCLRVPLLALALGVPASAALGEDLAALTLFKSAWYEQTGDADPVLFPQAADPYDITALAYLSEELLNDPDALMFLEGLTLRTPAGRVDGLDFDSFDGSFYLYEGAVSRQALNLRFGEGDYRFTLSSFITGDTVYTVPLPADDYPEAPRITNLPAAQQIDPARDFTLRWTAFTGGGERWIYISITDTGTGMDVFSDGPLDGEALATVIPAGTIQTGTAYEATLVFTRYTHVAETSLPASYAGFEAYNVFPLAAVEGGVLDPSRFTGWRLLGNGDLEVTLDCTPGYPLTLQGAAGPGGAWTNLQTTTPSAATATLVVPQTSLGASILLRAVQQ